MQQAEPQVVREGWLTKAPSNKNWLRFWDTHWKQRYFVLRSGDVPGDTCLVWYQDEQHRRSGKSKGTIHLQDCEQVDCNLSLQYERRNKRYSYKWIFDVRVSTPKGSVVYYFSAPSEDAMNSWVRDLCHVCHLEREAGSDGSSAEDASATRTANQLANHHIPQHTQMDQRYVAQPAAHMARNRIDPNPAVPRQQNGAMYTSIPSPTLSVNRPPTVVSHLSKPPAPPPESERSPQPYEEPNMSLGVPIKKEGYIPLAECLSDPVDPSPDPQKRDRLDATSDPMETPTVSVSVDFESTDQPPNYPPPPLPREDSVFQQQHMSAPHHHSRSPSKDSSASSVHLSSTESEQGENRRPSMGKPFAENFGDTLAPVGTPTSPVSPAASLYQRPLRSSDGSTASCMTDDLSPRPPPRPPKTRNSVSSSSRQYPYENNSPTKDSMDAWKYSRYDQVSFGQRDIVFGTLPATTKAMLNSGRRSDSSSGIASPSPFSTMRKNDTVGEKRETSMGTHFFGHDTMPTMTPDPRNDPRSRHTSMSTVQDTDASYSGITIGHPRVVPAPAFRPHSRSHSSDADANNGDQYQNFTPPPRLMNANRGTGSFPTTPQNPPEVKRELKPVRNRGPSLPNTGMGALPKLPDRLTDPRKGSLGSNTSPNPKEASMNEANGEPHMPQFNVERQVSFKSRPRTLGTRQQTAPTLGSGQSGGGIVRPGPLKGILDSEVRVEDYPHLEYITPAPVRSQITPPGTPSSSFKRNMSAIRSSPCPSSSPSTTTFEQNLPPNAPGPATGYVQIDPKATRAFETLMTARNLERNQQQQQPTNGTLTRKK